MSSRVIRFVDDIKSGVAMAKAAAGDKYVNVLGAGTAHQCVDVGPRRLVPGCCPHHA
jgi:hypothetical protein